MQPLVYSLGNFVLLRNSFIIKALDFDQLVNFNHGLMWYLISVYFHHTEGELRMRNFFLDTPKWSIFLHHHHHSFEALQTLDGKALQLGKLSIILLFEICQFGVTIPQFLENLKGFFFDHLVDCLELIISFSIQCLLLINTFHNKGVLVLYSVTFVLFYIAFLVK